MDIKHPPILNINGTSPVDLLQQYIDAHHAIQEAVASMKLAMPHGRDYPRGQEDYAEARKTYLEYIAKVVEAQKYVFELMLVVHDQKSAREEVKNESR